MFGSNHIRRGRHSSINIPYIIDISGELVPTLRKAVVPDPPITTYWQHGLRHPEIILWPMSNSETVRQHVAFFQQYAEPVKIEKRRNQPQGIGNDYARLGHFRILKLYMAQHVARQSKIHATLDCNVWGLFPSVGLVAGLCISLPIGTFKTVSSEVAPPSQSILRHTLPHHISLLSRRMPYVWGRASHGGLWVSTTIII